MLHTRFSAVAPNLSDNGLTAEGLERVDFVQIRRFVKRVCQGTRWTMSAQIDSDL